jgi:hypothetical protein
MNLHRFFSKKKIKKKVEAEGQEPSRAKIQAAYSDSGAKTASYRRRRFVNKPI